MALGSAGEQGLGPGTEVKTKCHKGNNSRADSGSLLRSLLEKECSCILGQGQS
jgi:hypothetical protein